MARYVFLTWNGAGNQPPAIGIAQALRERGHEVIFAGYESQRLHFAERGFEFKLLERASAAWGAGPPERNVAALTEMVWASRDHLDDVREAIADKRCDAIVVDCLMFGALVAAEGAGLPVAVLVHSAPGALVPPGGPIERAVLGPVNEMRQAAGHASVASLWEIWARFPSLCTTIAELDPLAARVPPSFDYIGPVFERVPASGFEPPWPEGDSRPLVLVSFSTGRIWDQRSRIQRTLEGLSGRACRVLVTTGPADVAGLRIPVNAVLVAYVPHQEVLPGVSVVVTHAGHGTLAAALAHGVPIVSLPSPIADQVPLAARIEALGAGCVLDGEAATAAEIATAVEQVLGEPSYAAAARRLAAAIASAPGVATAARQLEELAKRPAHTLHAAGLSG